MASLVAPFALVAAPRARHLDRAGHRRADVLTPAPIGSAGRQVPSASRSRLPRVMATQGNETGQTDIELSTWEMAMQGKKTGFTKNKRQLKELEELYDRVETGAIKGIEPADAASMLSKGWTLLDVRPAFEHDRGFVVGSQHVPLFVEDDPFESVGGFMMHWLHMGVGAGMYSGHKLTIVNTDFLDEVAGVADKKTPLLVACQEGLRSLLAIKVLEDAGYTKLTWLAGGLISCKDAGLPEEAGEVHKAHLGGASRIVQDIVSKD